MPTERNSGTQESVKKKKNHKHTPTKLNIYSSALPHRYPLTNDMFSREKLDTAKSVHASPHIFVHFSGSNIDLRPAVPFDQAALPDNQNMAKIVVSIKSANGISDLLL